tara:strand:+ start:2415 stop:2984 length:570 start_codon:yes stop_codon:yes gene_type:complete
MNIFSKVATTLVGATLLFTPSIKAETHEDHLTLWDALEENGIVVIINEPEFCNEEDIDGFYIPNANVLGICQDGRKILTNSEVEWTSNDYDTLRHEAQHAVQDCLSGKDNGQSRLLFQDKDKFMHFITNTLKAEHIENIIDTYRQRGASDEIIRMELEAFAVASLNNPLSIANGVNELCEGNGRYVRKD